MTVLDPAQMTTLAAVADHLIPAAHGMPSAAEVVGDFRLAFVVGARPDLLEPLIEALRPELGADPAARLAALAQDEPGNLGALQLVIVSGYYTDKRVRALIGYPGQEAIEVKSWVYPMYVEEGLIDKVLERGSLWRDPATGRRAVAIDGLSTYADRWSTASETLQGEQDGRDGS